MQIVRVISLSCIALALWCSAARSDGAVIAGKGKAKDGDSVLVGSGKSIVDVRLYGVDAPEYDQLCNTASNEPWKCGAAAGKAMAELVDGRDVRCEVKSLEPIGGRRPIAVCFVGNTSVNDEILRRGMAWSFERYLKGNPTDLTQGLGLWQGPSQAPWDYRADRWARYAARSPNGCPIIGNVSSGIFHTPWSPHYARLFDKLIASPDDATKEWICTTSDASAQGYRQAGVR